MSRAAILLIKAAVVVNVAFSVGTFSERFVADPASNLQQYVALAMWSVVIFASILARPVLRVAPWTDVVIGVVFYAFAAASILWSELAPASAMKGLALAMTTFGAYRLAVSTDLDSVVDSVIGGLLIVVGASAFLALAWPDIGVLKTWMHNGQWAGLFASKQTLGTAGALLMFFSAHRAMTRGGRASFLVVFSLAAACVIGSGSRGGGALALAAIASLYLSGRSRRLEALLAFGPILMIVVANLLIAYLLWTGYDFIPVFDFKLDFTERASIWEYALRHYPDHPVLGFGLNGFWSTEPLLGGFRHEHGWVLDNFHSGYIAILVETGMVGMALFALCFAFFGAKMAWLARSERMPRAHRLLLVSFVNLSFLINFTETFFLRSTSFLSVLLVVVLFVSSKVSDARPIAARPGDQTRRQRHAEAAPLRFHQSPEPG